VFLATTPLTVKKDTARLIIDRQRCCREEH
jgi:hypothetical protein